MKPIPAIVESAAHDVELSFSKISVALAGERDAENSAKRHESLAANARETAALRRREVGLELLKIRGNWPKHGPGSSGWTDFLKRLKLDDSTALRYMQEARTSPVHGQGNATQKPSVSGTVAPGPDDEDDLAERIGKLDPDARGWIMRSLRSSVAREREGDRDGYCTPPEITRLLPEVDLDPCSNPRSAVRAKQTYSLEANQNGLELSWFGLVYANVPFSDPLPWALKFAAERSRIVGAGFMVNADHSPRWWRVLNGQDPEGPTKPLILRLDFDERIEFVAPPGVTPSKNDRPQTLLMDDAFWAACSQVELLELGTLWRQHSNT